MTTTNVCGQSVPNCVTIDHTDNVALHNARVAFSNPPPHQNTARAVSNLLHCLESAAGARSIMIVGHGMQGLIITGTGVITPDSDAFIRLDNSGDWEPSLRRLNGQITELIFCSCDTGGGEAGFKLLRKVANTIGATVSGFTGLIFIDSQGRISCEPNSIWRHVGPGEEPPSPLSLEPRAKFTAETIESSEAIMDIKLKYHGEYRTVPVNEITLVSYYEPGPQEGRQPFFSLEREDAEGLLRLIYFGEPVEQEGSPLAVVTGEVEIKFTVDQKPEERRFVVYNGRLLQDTENPATFYYASPELGDALSKNP